MLTWVMSMIWMDQVKPSNSFNINYLPICRCINIYRLYVRKFATFRLLQYKENGINLSILYILHKKTLSPSTKTRKCSVKAVNCGIIYRGYPTKWVGVLDSLAI